MLQRRAEGSSTELGLFELIEQLKRNMSKLQLSRDHMFIIQSVKLELKFVV
jgi:hypothetical protein